MQRFDGGRLADDLIERGWLQDDLARSAGVHKGTVSRAITSECQNPKTWQKFAHALGRPLRRYLRRAA